MQPGVTLTGMGPVASIEYIDPDLLQGSPASQATDVWSLGITLHRVLTGQGIYGADLPADDGLLALRKALVTEPRIAPGLPDPVTGLIAACIGPVEARPTAAEFAQQVDTIQLALSPG